MLNETVIRLSVFLGLFMILAALEAAYPRRERKLTRKKRWLTNWALVVADTLTLRILALAVPLLAIGAAADATARGWGLFNYFGLSQVPNIVLTVLLFDLLIWAQHVVTHKIPMLWKIHRVHHSDEDIDVTTAVRFHPIEIALSMFLKIGAVYVLGPSAVGILVFEILLNGSAMFNHSNLKLPNRIDAVVRWVVVTPDMHRVHHSTEYSEHNMNYGFFLSIWDRAFKTYTAQPEAGHTGMTIGLDWQDGRTSRFGWLMGLPFRKP